MEKGFYYFLGKLTALTGAGLLTYLWMDKTFMRKGDLVQTDEGKNALIITDTNKGDYLVEHPSLGNTYVLTIPNETDIVIFDTVNAISVHNIMPATGDFPNGKDIKVGGNLSTYYSSLTKDEEYSFSSNIYQDMGRNNGGNQMNINYKNFIELTCWRKMWWFSV